MDLSEFIKLCKKYINFKEIFKNCHYNTPSGLFENSAWKFPVLGNLLFSETTDPIITGLDDHSAVNGLSRF